MNEQRRLVKPIGPVLLLSGIPAHLCEICGGAGQRVVSVRREPVHVGDKIEWQVVVCSSCGGTGKRKLN